MKQNSEDYSENLVEFLTDQLFARTGNIKLLGCGEWTREHLKNFFRSHISELPPGWLESCRTKHTRYEVITTPASLSKLEHFAGMAMQGICANQDLLRIWASQIDAGKISKELEQMIAKASVKTAKALLQELQTQGEE